jgi:uncharacterized protein YggE
MKRALLVLLIFGFATLDAPRGMCQESGNRIYNRGGTSNPRRTPPNTGSLFGGSIPGSVQFIEASVLLNAAPDQFVAVFGAAQEAPTAVESNQRVNAQIESFLSSVDKLGVNRSDTFIDFITQNRVFSFFPEAEGVVREKLTGFETKKTVAIRYKDRPMLERLLTAAAQAAIFDLIKVDYVINDMVGMRRRLFEEAARIVKQKEETYVRTMGLKFTRKFIYQESYDTLYPAELYQTYTAFESGSAENYYSSSSRVVIRERKSSTSYLEPLDKSAFDAVLSPIGIEPMVQSTLYLKVMYSQATRVPNRRAPE